MKTPLLILALASPAVTAFATVRYVDVNSTNATPPYTNWAMAATVIQDAVDAAEAGDEIVVTNGTYATGGGLSGDWTSRVAVGKSLALRSVNGPQFTVLKGGSSARCVSLTNGASLVGFTLANGYAASGGGVWCESTNAVLSNCVLRANSAYSYGGGAYSGTLMSCTLTSNSVLRSYAFQSGSRGGGAFGAALNNCVLAGNSTAWQGGGAAQSSLNNCVLSNNSGSWSGGGAIFSTLNSCLLIGNWADGGGAASSSTLNNCTLTGNSAYIGGGAGYRGVYDRPSTLNNCIVYFNRAEQGENYDPDSVLNHCCTTPLPASGVGNISDDPQLASVSHLSAASRCRGMGNAAYTTGTDIDGESWATPPSIGCDEYHAGSVTGELRVALSATFTNITVGFEVGFRSFIDGRTTASAWDFGDGMTVTNRLTPTHTWSTSGDFAVDLRAYNESHPAGVSATVMIHVFERPVHYVAIDSTNPVAPFTTWATAATNIQDAVDAASAVGATIVISNGIYAVGGRPMSANDATNRVAVDRPLMLRSVNGPRFTTIDGGGSGRCIYLTNGACLTGFTLTNGASGGGSGAYCQSTTAIVSNCVLVGNSVPPFGPGGGAYSGTLNNCTLFGNTAWNGGGAAGSTLNNCTVVSNLTGAAGSGTIGCAANNSIIYYNTDSYYAQAYDSTLNYCCTTADAGGVGTIGSPPLFVDLAGGNLRLQSNSPCINAGRNAYAPGPTDLDGNPRIVGGTVDIGAYEFQSPQSVLSYAWLQQYGLLTDGSADFSDVDSDGHNNWQEWRCQTDPTNALSVLRLLPPVFSPTNVTVSWQSVPGMNYFLERSTNLEAPSFTPLSGNLLGQAATTSYIDTNVISPGSFFYRVGVAP